MAKYSFIDYGNKDFVRNEDGSIAIIEASSGEQAEAWLLDNHDKTDWTNTCTVVYEWDDYV